MTLYDTFGDGWGNAYLYALSSFSVEDSSTTLVCGEITTEKEVCFSSAYGAVGDTVHISLLGNLPCAVLSQVSCTGLSKTLSYFL
jgi:hypothetical protein